MVAGNGSNVFSMGLRMLKGCFTFQGEMQVKSCEADPRNALINHKDMYRKGTCESYRAKSTMEPW